MSWSEEDQDSVDSGYDTSTVGVGTNTNQSYGGGNDTNYVNSYGIPVTDRSTNFIDFSSDPFSGGMANAWDRITGNTSNRFLNRMDLEDPRTFDAFFSGNPLDAFDSPMRGNDSIYDPRTRQSYGIIDDHPMRDFAVNFFNTVANPMPGLFNRFDTATVKNDLTGQQMNYQANQGLLSNSRLATDTELAQEYMDERNRDRGQGDQTDTIDNTGGMLATRDENGDIPWWVLANAGLLAV
jgi:hypothetical protein